MAMDSMLYEVCPHCDGRGHSVVSTPGGEVLAPCRLCKPLHVVATGLVVGQVERWAARAREEQEQRAGLSEAGRG